MHWLLKYSLIAVTLLSIGCTSTNHQAKTPPLVLGAIYNLHGYQAGLDIPSAQGARLAVAEINRNGGLLGKPLQLEIKDGESKPEIVAKVTAELLTGFPSTTALLGLSDTDMVLAAAPVAAANRRLFLTSGATSPLLPAQIPEYLFLACFGDNVQAAAAAEWAYNNQSLHSAAILFNSTKSYTRLLQGYFKTSFTQLGGKISATVGYTAEQLDRSTAERLRQADLIYLATDGPDETFTMVELLRNAGLSAPILGGDSFDAEQLWQQHPQVSNVLFTTHAYLGRDNANPKVVAFRNAYLKAYPGNGPDAFAALGYDAVNLLMTAINRAADPDPEAVLKALANIGRFEGVTGTMIYPPGSRIPLKTVSILGINQGQIRLVEELLPKHVPAP